MANFDQSMYSYMMERTSCLKMDNKMISFYGKNIVRSKFIEEVDNFAGFMQSIGVNKGDNVVICLGNIPNAVITFYAVNKIGAIANLLHPLATDEMLREVEMQMHPKLYIMFDEFYNKYSLFNEIDTKVVICSALDYLLKLFVPFYGLYTVASKNGIKYNDKTIKYSSIKNYKSSHVDIKGEDIAIYMHSSGTSGDSKIACISNISYNHLANNLIEGVYKDEMKCGEYGMLMALPIFHTFGLGVCVHTALCIGVSCVMVPKFNADYVATLMWTNKIVAIPGVPNMFRKLSKSRFLIKKSFKYLENCFCGGDKLPDDVKNEFEQKARESGSNLKISEGYGLTEVGVCLLNKQNDYKENSIGNALPGSEVIIIDEDKNILDNNKIGAICISSNSIMTKYYEYKDDSMFHLYGKDWFNTGDFGYMDETKHVYFVDRQKRLIKIAGNNVFPQQIEDVVNIVKEVEISCAVECIINNKKAIRLYVQLKDGIKLTDSIKERIEENITSRLLKYCKPYEIVQIDKIPLTSIGKVDFRKLK